MRDIPLTEFAAKHGQTRAAEMLGITQGALSKALRVGRRVTVCLGDDGTLSAHELRPFPSQQPKTAA